MKFNLVRIKLKALKYEFLDLIVIKTFEDIFMKNSEEVFVFMIENICRYWTERKMNQINFFYKSHDELST